MSLVNEVRSNDTVPEGKTPPKGSDSKGWTDLLANALASGEPKPSIETREYVSRLTHTKNAVRLDAEIGPKQVEFRFGLFTAAMLRLAHSPTRREDCQSYAVGDGVCRHCGWEDPDSVPALALEWSMKRERAGWPNRVRRLPTSRRS